MPALVAALLAACGGPGGAPTRAPAGVPTLALTPPGLPAAGFPLLETPLEGQIVYANGSGDLFVTAVTPGAKPVKVASPPGNKGNLQDPVWSPDGKRIAFTFLLPFDNTGLPAVDVMIAGADGGNLQTLIAHQANGEVLSGPVFAPDGKSLYYSRSTPIFKDKAVTGITLNLQRYDLATKQSQNVTADGTQPDISPDGKHLTFIRINPQTFQQDLMTVDVDGKNLEALVAGNDVSGMMAPRWSPDGKQILFSMPNTQAARAPAVRLPDWLERALGVRVAAAHGPPWDFWRVDANGQNLTRLTHIGEDEPAAAWSPDGKHFAFVGVAGFYIVDASGKPVNWLSRDGGKGKSDWRR